nr:MAG TPA: hypothetical protein [Caudoviricetes sp.]
MRVYMQKVEKIFGSLKNSCTFAVQIGWEET